MPDLLEPQDFSKPQRQSAAGALVLFAHAFQKIVRSLVVPLVYFLIKSDFKLHYVLAILAILALIVAVWTYLEYRRFTFYVDGHHQEFVINKGVINTTNLTIQLRKIQQVNINQSFLQRLVNVYTLEIDTAGSEKKEARIRAISGEVAERLKHILLEGAEKEEIDDVVADDQANVTKQSTKPLLKLSGPTLLKIGLTSNYGQTLALIVGFLLATYEGLKNLNELIFKLDQDEVGNRIQQGATLLSVCLLIVVILIFVLTINVIRVFLKYYHFKIVKQKNTLTITSGLLSTKNTVLNPLKVQMSSYSQNYFQKKLDILDMRMKQDSSTEDGRGEELKKSDVEIPGCSVAERDVILKMIFDEIPKKGNGLKANYRFVYSGIIFWMLLPVALLVFLEQTSFPGLSDWYPATLPWLLGTGTMIYFGYRNHRLYVSDNFIIKKSGIWDVQHQIIEPHKIQAITTKQMLWHRKSDVGHLTLYTAAGAVSFRFGNFTQVNILVNYWLYQIETSRKEWM